VEQVLNTQIYRVKYYKHLIKTKFYIILHIKISPTEQEQCLCRHYQNAALEFALSLSGQVTLGGKLLTIFMPA